MAQNQRKLLRRQRRFLAKISEKEIAIAGVNLIDDEFELNFQLKNIDETKFAVSALSSNDYLVFA